MKTYIGKRQHRAPHSVYVVDNRGGEGTLTPRFDLCRRHTLDSFDWGDGLAGSTHLALALCADALGDDEVALRIYQQIKWKLVAAITTDEWVLPEVLLQEAIREAIERLPPPEQPSRDAEPQSPPDGSGERDQAA